MSTPEEHAERDFQGPDIVCSAYGRRRGWNERVRCVAESVPRNQPRWTGCHEARVSSLSPVSVRETPWDVSAAAHLALLEVR